MRLAVVGCCHGELNLLYSKLGALGQRIDLVLVAGDFQAVRNDADLASMSVPEKYKRYGDFVEYYEGRRTAPFPTVFIGGNHEASNYMRELHYGGWVCPNIYYLGVAGVIRFGGLRISGLSGIYAQGDYHRGYHERLPIREYRDTKSVYHYRDLDVWRLGLISQPVDVMLSHDWPQNVWEYGDKVRFLKQKPFLKAEIERKEFGSPPLGALIETMHPRLWFAAHMHCRFEAQVGPTKFLALDKCLRGRQFTEIVTVTPSDLDQPLRFFYDPEWMAVLKATAGLMSHVRDRPSGPLDTLPAIGLDSGAVSDWGVHGLDSSVPIADAVRKHYEQFLARFSLVDPFKL